MFVNTFIDQIMRRLSELSVSAPIRWSRSEILLFINDGIAEFNLITGEIQGTETIELLAAQGNALTVSDTFAPTGDAPYETYLLGPDAVTGENLFSLQSDVCIAPIAVRVNQKFLRPVKSTQDLDKEADFEQADQIASAPSQWCPLGLDKIILHKRSITPGQTAIVTELVHPDPVIDSGSSSIPLPDEYAAALDDFVVSRALFKEGGPEAKQGVQFYDQFLDVAQQRSGRNTIRRYPPWTVMDQTDTVTLRGRARDIQKTGGR